MKIAYIGSRGFPGFNAGVEKSLEEICPRLASKGHEITVYCSEQVATAEPIFKNTILRRTPAVLTKHLETMSRTFLSGWSALFEQYDIVHFHSIGPALLSWMTRFGQSRKTVVTVHGLDWQREKWGKIAQWSLLAGERSSVLFPDHTIVVSKFLKRYFESHYGREVSYIPNGVAVQEPLIACMIKEKWGLEQGSYILFASRLVPEKECHTLIEAFKRLKTDIKLVIAGSSWHSEIYEAQLHRQAKGHGNIIFTGWASGSVMKELYSNALLYCLPSTIEGLSLSLLEAMSYGICPVVSDIPENVDVIEAAGRSFEVGNVESLSEVLQDLLDHPDESQALGQSARKLVDQHYSWDRDVEELEKTYLRLLN